MTNVVPLLVVSVLVASITVVVVVVIVAVEWRKRRPHFDGIFYLPEYVYVLEYNFTNDDHTFLSFFLRIISTKLAVPCFVINLFFSENIVPLYISMPKSHPRYQDQFFFFLFL